MNVEDKDAAHATHHLARDNDVSGMQHREGLPARGEKIGESSAGASDSEQPASQTSDEEIVVQHRGGAAHSEDPGHR